MRTRNIAWIALLAFALPTIVSAFGVSPPFINADRLVKGSRYETTVYLVQGQPDKATEVTASFDVPEKVRGWFSIDVGESFTIPAGIQQFPIKVAIQVPKDAELGVYKGFLTINTVPVRQEGEQVNIAVGARINMNLTVGEGVISDFAIRKLDILDIEEGDPPKIVLTLENLGNVPISPERATLDLLDKYGSVRLGFAQKDKLPEVAPFQTKSFVVEFPIDLKLGIGEYWAEAKIYRDGKVNKELKTVFNVVEKKFDYALYGGLALGLLALVALFLSRKKIRKLLRK